ncbi:MAG: rhamnulokinase [Actinomycetota bacterium]|nr:rhamnulokinase [Actinomycetota bacterium]
MSSAGCLVAVDLGASGGRVGVGQLADGQLRVDQVSRFANGAVAVGEHLYWDILGLWRSIAEGLAQAQRVAGEICSVGIDSWAVDYGLLDEAGELLGNPVHYRDPRTDTALDVVAQSVSLPELYARTGIAPLRIITAAQLVAAAGSPQLAMARQLLLVPDLLGFWLTGERVAEITNASTTGLLAADGRRWDIELMTWIGIDPGLFATLVPPGRVIGTVSATASAQTGLATGVPLTSVGSHDTASAVVAVPASEPAFAYISSGTWSLVGVERDTPLRSEAARVAGFTNERGVDGTVRFLRNVMGHWLLQESMRAWQRAGEPVDLAAVLEDARHQPLLRRIIDVDDPLLVAPGDMPGRIAELCRRAGEPEPRTPGEVARCIVDSLALAHRRAVHHAQILTGLDLHVVHIVGGGAQNELLCQLTADACGLPVIAGPVEATALGNLLVQARTAGLIGGGLAELRAVSRASTALYRYAPGSSAPWARAESRLERATLGGEPAVAR